jgi:hypothetical protein
VRGVIVCALLAACNQIYGLEETSPAPADPASNLDGDKLLDIDDNCPTIANNDQSDFDKDGVGDVCDNCPLVANTLQANNADAKGDAVGDDCDPNPTLGGDCLIVFDRFTDPSHLIDDWEVLYATGDTPPEMRYSATDEGVVLTPRNQFRHQAMVARIGGARMIGRFSVGMAGAFRLAGNANAEAIAAVDVESSDVFSFCSLRQNAATDEYLSVAGNLASSSIGYMSASPLRPELALRATVDRRGAQPRVSCGIFWGVAIGASQSAALPAIPPPSAVGVIARIDPITVRAVAIYESRSPCPATVQR